MPIADPLERRAADLFAGHSTKLGAKKQLMAEGASEEQARLAVETGWQLYEVERRKRHIRNRLIGAALLIVGGALNAYTLFFIEGWIIAVAALMVLPIAGLFALIDPDSLSDFHLFFRRDDRP